MALASVGSCYSQTVTSKDLGHRKSDCYLSNPSHRSPSSSA